MADLWSFKNNCFKDTQITKGRYEKSEENYMWIKWKYQSRDRKAKEKKRIKFWSWNYNNWDEVKRWLEKFKVRFEKTEGKKSAKLKIGK